MLGLHLVPNELRNQSFKMELGKEPSRHDLIADFHEFGGNGVLVISGASVLISVRTCFDEFVCQFSMACKHDLVAAVHLEQFKCSKPR